MRYHRSVAAPNRDASPTGLCLGALGVLGAGGRGRGRGIYAAHVGHGDPVSDRALQRDLGLLRTQWLRHQVAFDPANVSKVADSRCRRSPRPVKVRVYTSWPAVRRARATGRQHQPSRSAPCTRARGGGSGSGMRARSAGCRDAVRTHCISIQRRVGGHSRDRAQTIAASCSTGDGRQCPVDDFVGSHQRSRRGGVASDGRQRAGGFKRAREVRRVCFPLPAAGRDR